LYRLLGEKAAYTRQAGFDRLQHEQLVKNYVAQHGRITRQEVIELCRLSPDQAYKLLKRLAHQNKSLKNMTLNVMPAMLKPGLYAFYAPWRIESV
jgi:hypothetical protein